MRLQVFPAQFCTFASKAFHLFLEMTRFQQNTAQGTEKPFLGWLFICTVYRNYSASFSPFLLMYISPLSEQPQLELRLSQVDVKKWNLILMLTVVGKRSNPGPFVFHFFPVRPLDKLHFFRSIPDCLDRISILHVEDNLDVGPFTVLLMSMR